MIRSLLLAACLLASLVPPARAQSPGPDPATRRWFVGGSLFMLANTLADESPSFYQVNLGRRLTPRDTISLELITWRYGHPLGIPYGPSFGAKDEAYPGFVRGTGAGVAYQRNLRGGLYLAVHAAALRQDYQDPDTVSIQQGVQLFTALRLGYRFELFNGRVFLEPSIAITSWPVNTNAPDAFRALDEKWRRYFVGEPGLHFGVRF